MTDLQKELLTMFIWLNDFCIKNNIKYYMLGGTMLGAARHHGFIPWDDDIDIGIPREDYNRIISLLGDKRVDKYYLETPFSSDKNYKYPYCKLYDTTTTLVENTWPVIKKGIFIDIFPLDALANDEKEAEKEWKKIYYLTNILWCRFCAINKERSLIKNSLILAFHLIPQFVINDKKLLIHINDLAQSNNFFEKEYGGNIFGNWGSKEIMKTSIMGQPTKYTFEGFEFFGPENYDDYLTKMYGNWKELPPLEKQVTHHDYLEFDMNKSYIE